MSFGSFGSGGGGGLFGGQQQQQTSGGFGSGGFGGGGSTFGSSNNTFGGGNAFGATNSGFGQPQQNNQAGGFNANSTNSNAMGGGGMGMMGSVANTNNDYEIPRDQNSPQDTISCVQWSPVNNTSLLLASSWDSKVRCYNVQDNGSNLSATLNAFIAHQGPVLDCHWKQDGTGCFSAGCDKMVKMWNFENSQGQQNAQDVGRHDAPVRAVRWIPQRNLLVSGGWDNKLNYWDLRSPNPAATVQLPGRVDCMDVKFPYCVVATGGSENERQILIYNLNANPAQPERILNQTPATPGTSPLAKPLKKQYRCLEIFPNVSGFAVASIEGRCSIQYFTQDNIPNNFAFKCHRDKNTKLIYSVNSLAFHTQFGTFASAGSDGLYNFWDKDSKQRLKASNTIKLPNNEPAPITSSAFSANGNLYAYSVSYDWSKGAAANPAQNINTIMIHRTTESEVKPKKYSGVVGRRY